MKLKCEIESLDIKPGQIITVRVDSNKKVTEMSHIVRYAKALAQMCPKNPVAIVYPDLDIAIMNKEEFEKQYINIMNSDEIDGQITIEEYLEG